MSSMCSGNMFFLSLAALLRTPMMPFLVSIRDGQTSVHAPHEVQRYRPDPTDSSTLPLDPSRYTPCPPMCPGLPKSGPITLYEGQYSRHIPQPIQYCASLSSASSLPSS